MTDSPFDTDPAALEWARGRVQAVTSRWRQYAQYAADNGMDGNAEKWRRIAQITENDLIGGVTDHIAAFDRRRPTLPDTTLKGEANDASTVEEVQRGAGAPVEETPGQRVPAEENLPVPGGGPASGGLRGLREENIRGAGRGGTVRETAVPRPTDADLRLRPVVAYDVAGRGDD